MATKPRLSPRDDSTPTVRTVAVICDPEAAPAEIASHLSQVLPKLLTQICIESSTFEVCLHRERLPIGPEGDHQSLVQHAERMKRQQGWDAAVCV
ncbi:MAG: hypothetical protein U1C73_13850, partial [Dietzia sp.]|nr:hypothetical protein [Dietzia sp.]